MEEVKALREEVERLKKREVKNGGEVKSGGDGKSVGVEEGYSFT